MQPCSSPIPSESKRLISVIGSLAPADSALPAHSTPPIRGAGPIARLRFRRESSSSRSAFATHKIAGCAVQPDAETSATQAPAPATPPPFHPPTLGKTVSLPAHPIAPQIVEEIGPHRAEHPQ